MTYLTSEDSCSKTNFLYGLLLKRYKVEKQLMCTEPWYLAGSVFNGLYRLTLRVPNSVPGEHCSRLTGSPWTSSDARGQHCDAQYLLGTAWSSNSNYCIVLPLGHIMFPPNFVFSSCWGKTQMPVGKCMWRKNDPNFGKMM